MLKYGTYLPPPAKRKAPVGVIGHECGGQAHYVLMLRLLGQHAFGIDMPGEAR